MKKRVVILGGGVGGFFAGWMLARTNQFDVTVIEISPVVGGMCATFQYEDMRLDYGPHKCYSTMPDTLAELKNLMGEELITHKKKNSIYLFGKYLDYPLRLSQLLLGMGPKNVARCSADFLTVLSGQFSPRGKKAGSSYEEYVISRFGKGIYELV